MQLAAQLVGDRHATDVKRYVAKFFDDLAEKHPKSEGLKCSYLPLY